MWITASVVVCIQQTLLHCSLVKVQSSSKRITVHMHTSLEDTEIPCDNCVCIVKFCAAVGTVQFMMETNITTVSFLDREAVK